MTKKSPREIERALDDLVPDEKDEDDLHTIVIRSRVVGSEADTECDLPLGEWSLASQTRIEEQPDGSWTSSRQAYDVPNDRLEQEGEA